MSAITSATPIQRAEPVERISWPRLAWVAPLTLIAALGVCYALKTLFVVVDPSLSQMGQLGMPMLTLAAEGALAAIVVFVLFALIVPRPIFWYRIVGAIALVLSWAPDIGLGLGGTPMQLSMRFVGPLTSVGRALSGSGGGGPPAGGPAPATGGGAPGGLSGMPLEHVAVLMLLHTAVAVVCIGMLTTLARTRATR
jgi:hypothetical protein